MCHKPNQENSWHPLRGGPGLSGTWFSTSEALQSGSQEAVWGLSVWGPAEVNRAGGPGAVVVWLGQEALGRGPARGPDWSAPSLFRWILVWSGL